MARRQSQIRGATVWSSVQYRGFISRLMSKWSYTLFFYFHAVRLNKEHQKWQGSPCLVWYDRLSSVKRFFINTDWLMLTFVYSHNSDNSNGSKSNYCMVFKGSLLVNCRVSVCNCFELNWKAFLECFDVPDVAAPAVRRQLSPQSAVNEVLLRWLLLTVKTKCGVNADGLLRCTTIPKSN